MFQSLNRDRGLSNGYRGRDADIFIEFQSLNRDRGLSNEGFINLDLPDFDMFQSLNRDRGLSNVAASCSHTFALCFNPSIGIGGFQTTRGWWPAAKAACFNPSIGIGGFQTIVIPLYWIGNRNVSIPQSG